MSLPTNCMRIALLINHSPTDAIAEHARAWWKRAIKAVEPTARIDVFDPILVQEYPDQFNYDLIILSGGSTDPRSKEPWVLKMMDFIREVAEAQMTKLLGVCWGHQAIAQALGGTIETMETGPIGDLSTIQLTPEGQAFLGFPTWKTSFQAPEFHLRWVAEPVEGFIPLAENNQAFLGRAGQIFTFQTHPEIDDLALQAVLDSTDLYTKGKSQADIESLQKRSLNGHDGQFILSKVVHWVYDHN